MARQDQGIIRDGYNAARPTGGGFAGRKVRPMGVSPGSGTGYCTTRYFSSAGTELWNRDHGATVHDVAIDSSGNLYECGETGTGGYHIRKRDSLGNLLWSKTHGAELRSMAIHPTGVVAGGVAGTGGYTIRKWDADGTLAWSATTAYDVLTLDVDPDGITIANSVERFPLDINLNESPVAFFSAVGGLISETDISQNFPTSGHEGQTVTRAVCFWRLTSYVGIPYTDRWVSAYSHVSVTFGARTYHNFNGDISLPYPTMGLGGSPQGEAMEIKVRNTGFISSGFPQHAAIIATTHDVLYARESLTPSSGVFYESLTGGSKTATADANIRIHGGTNTLFRFPPRDYTVSGTPWSTVADGSFVHGGTIYGSDVNDSGTVAICGARVAL